MKKVISNVNNSICVDDLYEVMRRNANRMQCLLTIPSTEEKTDQAANIFTKLYEINQNAKKRIAWLRELPTETEIKEMANMLSR